MAVAAGAAALAGYMILYPSGVHKRYQRQGDFRCDRQGAGEDASPQGPRDRSGGTKGLNR